jgi:hypothetical protein
MIRRSIPISVKGYLTILALLVVSTALAGSPQQPLAAAQEDKSRKTDPDANEEIRREAEKVVDEINLEVLDDDEWIKVDRIEKPLLFYGDHTRNNDRGSVWGWGRKGRPVALLELFQALTDRTKWEFAICNTSGKRLRATRAGAPWWRENDSIAELKDVPGAPAPSAEASQRKRQLKLLAQKFTAHQFWDPDNTKYDLRRLDRPLYTYQDDAGTAGGVLEGALFTFANGTNPEIMLFLEARSDAKDAKKVVWQYTVGRSAHAELHLQYDGKEVFNAPRGNRVSAPDKPYWLGSIVRGRVREREKK